MAESIYNEADLFRSDNIHGKASALAVLMGGQLDVKKGPNKPTCLYAHFGGSDGMLYGHMFSPNAPSSKGVIPQLFKSTATTAFSDKVNLMLNGSMSTEEVVQACYDEVSVKCPGLDAAKLVEESANEDEPNIPNGLRQVAKVLKENDVCNIPEEMLSALIATTKAVFLKKKQNSRGQGQQVASQA